VGSPGCAATRVLTVQVLPGTGDEKVKVKK
jgi:hypothetical protein